MTRAESAQKKRIAKGLCPQCGEEAAPYYLCHRCRSVAMITRCLKKGVDAGALAKTVKDDDRRVRLYAIGDNIDTPDWRYEHVTNPDDGRLKPRIRNIPVDVERELFSTFEKMGEPLGIEEIMAAWGILRLRKQRVSAASDLRSIILAHRKRQRRGGRP